MPAHPSIPAEAKAAIAVSAVAGAAGLWGMLALYGGLDGWAAAADSLAYMAPLALAGYFYRYAAGYMRGIVPPAVVALVVQLLCIGIASAMMAITGLCTPETFLRLIPMHAVYGLLLWAALPQRHYTAQDREDAPEETAPEPTPAAETIDRISVKNGADIEIIPVAQLTYIQAYGDYVMLHTETARHIKEQTMRFYETSLPETFVRIHRSFIVNTERIARIELAGKENYTIKLKNGVAIRASAAGYKLLRQRLSL